ncbi:LuxR family transcriptional regulator [Streptomyces sp. TRM70308]|uniref:helix-turn-helix transcriptional regulator n=1 Tax=Streptomyces sp. TRM70308 TaxID=3131932 RepID=UPI003CFCD597
MTTAATSDTGARRLYGRRAELAAVHALLRRTSAGRGGALLLTGAPGLGRTALTREAARALPPPGVVLDVRGVAAERELPGSGLHALRCRVAQKLGTPEPPPTPPGPGGLLDLLARLAAPGRPLLVSVDDAHLLDADSRAALGYAARRLGPGRPVGVLLSAPPGEAPEFAGLPTAELRPLAAPAATALLRELLGASAEYAVPDGLLDDADGSPALLTELAASARRLRSASRAGTAWAPGATCPGTGPALEGPHPPGSLLARYAARLAALPDATRRCLLLAAAARVVDDRGRGGALGDETGRLLRALAAAELDPACLEPAEAAGLLRTTGGRVRFAPPVLGRLVYGTAPLAARRAAHAVFAASPHAEPRPLLRLHHQAYTSTGPDAGLAAALAEAAAYARDHVEAAAVITQAARLSEDDEARVGHLAAAADHARAAGRPGQARALLDQVRACRGAALPPPPAGDRARERPEPGPAGAAVRGRAELVRGTLELRDGHVGDAHAVLHLAAELLAPADPARAAEAMLGAAEAAWAAGDLPGYVAALTRAGEVGPLPPLLADYRGGMAALLGGEEARGRRLLRRTLERAAGEDDPVRLVHAGGAALVLGDVPAARAVGARTLAAARARGLGLLVPQALEYLAYAELRSGEYARAMAHAHDGLAAARAAGQRNPAAQHHAALALAAAVVGSAEECRAHAEAATATATRHGLGVPAGLAVTALAHADLGHGRARAAADRLRPLVLPGPHRGHPAVRVQAAPVFIEAAALTGARQEAATALAEFTEWAGWTVDPLAGARLARCRALLAPPEEAEALYARALACHERASGAFERARTLLLSGKALRRRRRPLRAREHLRDALVGFEGCGAAAWREQARAELRATGESVGAPAGGPAACVPAGRGPEAPRPLAGLTPQQLRIARYVAEGATNREVAERLSVSPRTVDYHLRNVFAALGVRSRVELTRLVGRSELRAGSA